MSTRFDNEGNIGSAPEYHEFPTEDGDEPDRMLRFPVFFDNSVLVDGTWQDRGGFWLPVELRHADAQQWQSLYQKGMRVAVRGRLVKSTWLDTDQKEQAALKVRARVVAILPHRIESITLSPKAPATSDQQE